MSKIRTLVGDDEPIARARVVSLLREEDDIELVGECASGGEVLTAIERTSPDLLFLDIQMPEVDGIELARAVQGKGTPAVVFVTAYDEYALRAFEVRALDYLLKPFSAERFRTALGHARERVTRRRSLGGAPRDLLVIKSAGRLQFVRAADIDWCEAAGNYVRLHVGAQIHLIRETMGHLESQLDPQRFLRIHRSTIVNIERIQEMQPAFNGDYVVLLRTGTRLTLTRGYRESVRERLGKPL